MKEETIIMPADQNNGQEKNESNKKLIAGTAAAAAAAGVIGGAGTAAAMSSFASEEQLAESDDSNHHEDSHHSHHNYDAPEHHAAAHHAAPHMAAHAAPVMPEGDALVAGAEPDLDYLEGIDMGIEMEDEDLVAVIDETDDDEIGVEVLGITEDFDDSGIQVDLAYMTDGDEVAVIVEDIQDGSSDLIDNSYDVSYPDDGEVIDISEQIQVAETYDEPYIAQEEEVYQPEDNSMTYTSDDSFDYDAGVEVYDA